MTENIKTEAFKVVEIKPGIYVRYHEAASGTFKVTDDITKARKYDIFSNEARPCATQVHGDIKELHIKWEVK